MFFYCFTTALSFVFALPSSLVLVGASVHLALHISFYGSTVSVFYSVLAFGPFLTSTAAALGALGASTCSSDSSW